MSDLFGPTQPHCRASAINENDTAYEPSTRTKYTYDAAGNLLNDGSHQYFYDAENHLIQVDGSSGYCGTGTGTTATACYFYNAEGHRIRNTAVPSCNGTTGLSGGMGYTYDLSGRWIMEVAIDSGGSCNYEHYAGGHHLAHTGGTTNYSHTDWLGTERLRTQNVNPNAGPWVACESIASLPFGDGQVTTPLYGGGCYHDSRMHFTGKERDAATGLDNFGARFDSSQFGRFMSPDAFFKDSHVSDPRSWNEYAYTRNNPLRYTDPNGEKADVSTNCTTDQQNHTTCNVTISASIAIYATNGSNLSQGQLDEAASTIKSNIETAWTGSFTQDGVTYNVNTQVSVSVANSEDAAVKSGAQNVIGLTNGSADAAHNINSHLSFKPLLGGPDRGIWNYNTLPQDSGHEFTHILGTENKPGPVLSNGNILNDSTIPHFATSSDFTWGIREAIRAVNLHLGSVQNEQSLGWPTPNPFTRTVTVGAPYLWWK